MNILLTNDDGYRAKGILALKDALSSLSFVNTTIIAPSQEQSASSHGLSINSPLMPHKINDEYFYIEGGKPADCVFVALNEMLKDKNIDLLISGINHGSNLGEDVTYSGTVGAAIEGVLHNVPSIAISQYCEDREQLSFELAKKVIIDIVNKIHNNEFPLQNRKLLNINIPNITPDKLQGYEITRTGYKLYADFAKVHTNFNPRGESYYWLGLNSTKFKKETHNIMSDFEAIKQNRVSITPIKVDMTDFDEIKYLKEWIDK